MAGAQFEDQLRTINTVAKLPEATLQGIGNQIQALAETSGKSTDDLTAGFYDLVSAGIPADKAMASLKASATLATGALGTTGQAVDLVTSSLGAYNLDASESTRVTDIWAQAVADGKTTVADLAGGISQVAPIAAAAGVSLEEVAAQTTIMTLKGDTAAQAMTRIKAAISALLTPNAELAALSKKVGINFAELAKEQGLGVALEKLRQATKGNDEQFAKMLGSTEALGLGLVVTGDGAAAAAAELLRIKDGADKGGVALDQATEKMKSGVEAGNRLRQTLMRISQDIGEAFAPIAPAMQALGPVLGQSLAAGMGGLGGLLARVLIPAVAGLAIPGAVAGTTVGTVIGTAMGVAIPLAIPIALGAFVLLVPWALGQFLKPASMQDSDAVLADALHGGPALRKKIADILNEAISTAVKAAAVSSAPYITHIGEDTGVGFAQAVDTGFRDEGTRALGRTVGSFGNAMAVAMLHNQGLLHAATTDLTQHGILTPLQVASIKAGVYGGQVPAHTGAAIRAGMGTVRSAMAKLKWEMEHPIDLAADKAFLKGELHSSRLAKGLKSKNPDIRAAAQAEKDAINAELEKIRAREIAAQKGREFKEALAAQLKLAVAAAAAAAAKINAALASGASNNANRGDRHRASGGPVFAGSVYQVGEHGPETLVQYPGGGGFVYPHVAASLPMADTTGSLIGRVTSSIASMAATVTGTVTQRHIVEFRGQSPAGVTASDVADILDERDRADLGAQRHGTFLPVTADGW